MRAQTNTDLSAVTNSTIACYIDPSIILILADNIGFGDLGSYGQTKIKTPHLDQLASEGIRFTSYYICRERTMGRPRASAVDKAWSRGVTGASFSHPLPMDAFTVAALLKEAGYQTGLIGEWSPWAIPRQSSPNAKGFDEFAGFLSQTHARDYFSESIYRQNTATGSNLVETLPANWNGAQGIYLPDLLGEAAGNFIKINKPDRVNHYRGLFLCLSYPIPHYGAGVPKDSPYSGESWPQPAKDRATMITHMDESIGHVLDVLAQSKMDTNTVVIFTSLGGPLQEGAMDPKFFNAAGPLRGEAGSVFEGGIRMPMIIRWPARIKPRTGE